MVFYAPINKLIHVQFNSATGILGFIYCVCVVLHFGLITKSDAGAP